GAKRDWSSDVCSSDLTWQQCANAHDVGPVQVSQVDDEPGAFAHCFQVWAGDAEEPVPLPGDGAQVEGAYPDLVVVADAGDPTPTRHLFEQSMDGRSR